MNNVKPFPKKIFLILFVSFLIIAACSNPETENTTKESVDVSAEKPAANSIPAIEADLTVPPPGSQATQEKWDSFTDEKRQESWTNYITSLNSEEGEADAPEAVVKTSSSERAVSIVIAPLSIGDMDIYYYGIGVIEAGKVMKVIPSISGTAAKLYVTEGDFVEPGDLIFALDSSEWVRELERAGEKWEAELNLAEIRLNEANQELERSQIFFDRDLVTKQELDKADQNANEAQLNLEKVQFLRETELEILQENYKSRLGVSPGRGYVSDMSFSEGESVNSGDYVEIVNLEEVQLTVEVPEHIIPRIKRGSAVLAKTPSASRYGMEGEITGHNILPENNRTYKVRANLTNPNQRLFPGMLMEVQIQISQLQPRFIVPRQSVITEGADHFIYIVEDNQSRKVPVQLGTGRQGFVQVEGELEEGASLVVEGQSYLKPGSSVVITQTRGYLPERTEL